MPPAPPPSALDGNQVLQHAFEDATGRLRVDASVSATIGDLELDISHVDDSIRLGDGINLITATTIGSDVGLDVNIINSSIIVSATDLDIRNINSLTDNIAISDGVNVLVINSDGSINNRLFDGSGNSLNSTLGSLDVNITSSAIDIRQLDSLTPLNKSNPDNILISGSEDGSIGSNKYGFINNIRLQILATGDRNQEITYVDFGTKNQRITQIDYTSSLFPGTIARKTISYTLVGNRYRRDNITWSII